MAIELKIPEVGESIKEVQISEWLKKEGDTINVDEPVAVIDSEKTTFELPAPQSGRLVKILHQAGDTVKVGETVAQIDVEAGANGEKKTAANESPTTKAESPTDLKPKTQTKKKQPEKQKGPDDLTSQTDGAVTAAEPGLEKEREAQRKPFQTDAPEANASGKEPPEVSQQAARKMVSEREEEIIPMTMLRRTVARRLVEARQQMAMLTTFNEVDLTAVQGLRQEHGAAFEQRYAARLGYMSFFVKAVIDALKQFPALNAEIREPNIVYRNFFDIGVAIASDRGLVVPVLRNAERLSFAELERAIADFAQRARTGKLKPVDLEGGTFSVTNGGGFGSLLSTPIINPPQTGILGMHAIQERPVALAGQIVIRPMMYLALSYDHRLVDGREAVLFLKRIKDAVEDPARMLIEI